MNYSTDFENMCVPSKESFFNILKPHINACPSVVIHSLEDYENANLDERNSFFCSFSGPLLASVFLHVQNESSKLKQKTLDFWVVKKKDKCTDKLEGGSVGKELESTKKASRRKNNNSETNLNEVPAAKRCVRACRIKKSPPSSTSQNQVTIFQNSPSQAEADLIENIDVHTVKHIDLPSSSKIVAVEKEVPVNTNEKIHKSPVSLKPKRGRSKKTVIVNDHCEEGMLMDADKIMSSAIANTDIPFEKDNKTDKVDKPTSLKKTRKGIKNEKQNKDKIPLKSHENDDLFVASSSIDASSKVVAVAGFSETSSTPVSSKNKAGFHSDQKGKKIVKCCKKLILPISSDNTAENVKIKQSNTLSASKPYRKKGKKNIVDLCNPESIIPYCEEQDKGLMQTKCLNQMEIKKLTPQTVKKEQTLSPAMNSKTSECDDIQRTLRSKKPQRGRKRIVSSESDSQKCAISPKCQEANPSVEGNILTHVSSEIQNKFLKNDTQQTLVSITKSRKGRRRTGSDEQTLPVSNFQEVLKSDVENTSKTVSVKRTNKALESDDNCSPIPEKNSKRKRKKIAIFESIKETSSEPDEEKSIASVINDYSEANIEKSKFSCVAQSECQQKTDCFDLSEKNLENILGPSKMLQKRGRKRKAFEKMGSKKKSCISSTSEEDFEKSPIGDEKKSKLLCITESLHQVEIHDFEVNENNNKCTFGPSENCQDQKEIDTSEINSEYTLGPSTKVRRRGRKNTYEKLENECQSSILKIMKENLGGVEKSPENIQNESKENNSRNAMNETDGFLSTRDESTGNILKVKEKENEITHDSLKALLPSKELNDKCDQIPLPMQGKYAAYCKLRDQLTAIGLDIEDLFKYKEVQDMISNSYMFKKDGIIFIGSHKLPSTGETVPVVHTHRSKSELVETIQKLSSKGEKIIIKQ